MKKPIAVVLPLLVLGFPLFAPALAQTTEAERRAQEANRDRCRNGLVLGGLTGAVVSGRGLGNKLGGAAIGATAGCILNKELNKGK
ncbi:hypothetical protein [Synechococcus sp. CCY 9618]|uniref:hypothetical protein n=1 Tax=Synechococcus sp. CCY 9618 TaxID=2815602 RepID=UPI001C224B37|nr:hypothetical protein [Synechococcus sp. CCY 9618]